MNHIRAVFWLFALLLPLGLAWLGNFKVTTPVDLRVAVEHHLPGGQPLAREWDVEPAFPNLRFRNALLLRESPTAANEWFLVERTGRILAFKNDRDSQMSRIVVDLTRRLGEPLDQEQGVLGLAIHPKFDDSNSVSRGDIFVFYAGREVTRCFNRLSRFHVTQNPDATLASEVVLIDQTDPHPWHNAGCLEFGPDGFLYLGVGDGGGLNDEFKNSQRIDAGLFSGILRIDVDRRGGEISHRPPRQPAHGRTTGYFIPNDNPFVGRPDSLEEFWSIGLRNPFRMGFDAETKQLWVADVGSLGAEEINLVTPGSNHQWSYREGFEPFPYSPLKGSIPENLIGLESTPRHAYPETPGTHCTQEGFCVIGGAVYRGERHPSLDGQYVFGDFGTGRVWAMRATSEVGDRPRELLQLPSSGDHRLCSISIDRAGEIYLVVGATAEESSMIYRLKARDNDGEPLPKLLSETGLFRSLKPLMAGPGLIPYEVNSSLWSNGATKNRWIGLPALERVEVLGDGRWVFPQGTIFVKHFEAPAPTTDSPPRKLETRILVRSREMGLYGATYRWRDDGSDALLVDREGENCEALLPASDGQFEPQSYHLPGRNECLHCHNQHAGLILGVNSKQLNRPSSEGQENQLTHLSRLNLFNRKLTIAEMSRQNLLPPIEGPIHSLDRRVRSYLDANCSHCHRPGANIRAWFDLRVETPLAATGLLNGNVADDLEIDDARVIVPGNPDRSILFQRIAHRDPRFRMPPIAVSVVDQIAVREIQTWITQMRPSTERDN